MRRHADAQTGLRLLAVADRLDVMTVGVKDERPIVVFVIMRAQPRWSVVLSPDRERRAVKLLHGFPVLGREGDVVPVCKASLRPIQKNAFRPAP